MAKALPVADDPDRGLLPDADIPDATVDVAELLSRLAAELHDLSQRSMRIEDAVCRALDGARMANGPPLEDLQALDALTQTLRELSFFLDVVARSAPGCCDIPLAAAAKSVRLRALAERLSGAAPGHADAAGDFQLF